MGAIRVRLLKSYTHPELKKTWPVGTILQLSPQFASDLIHSKTAQRYEDEYPPKNKLKMKLENLKQ